jgi:amidohydrolase
MARCELDALPINESMDIPYCSEVKGVSHKCGHDGHMTIMSGLAQQFQNRRPGRGSVILLFQPAEETGHGARKVLDDDKFKRLSPDYIVALHNLPGFKLGQVIIKNGVFASASIGLRIKLMGNTSHAGEPEKGNSPAPAVAQLIQVLSSIPQFHTSLHEAAQITVIHAGVGEVAFGTSPGEGHVMATLRAYSREVIERLTEKASEISARTADTFGLEAIIDTVEPFPPTDNDLGVVELIEKTARSAGMGIYRQEFPFPWSEDFGHFTKSYRAALFGLGAGENHPALHHPDYDFPDALIEPGIRLFESLIRIIQDKNYV